MRNSYAIIVMSDGFIFIDEIKCLAKYVDFQARRQLDAYKISVNCKEMICSKQFSLERVFNRREVTQTRLVINKLLYE